MAKYKLNGTFEGTIEEIVEPIPFPTVKITATPQSIEKGQSVTLSWISTNAQRMTLYSPEWASGINVEINGSKIVTPNVGEILFRIIAEGFGGSCEDFVTVKVADIVPPPTPPADYVTDTVFYPIPIVSKPDKGVPYIDPIHHTQIIRITDPSDYGTKYMHCGYPKHGIENADGTMIFLQAMKYPGWILWNPNPPYNYIKPIPIKISSDDIDPDVRWDMTDPNILYSTFGSKMFQYNVKTDAVTLLHDFKVDFPDLPIARVYTAEEGDGSADRRYWAFVVRCYDASHDPAWWNPAMIVYDRIEDKIASVITEDNPLYVPYMNYIGITFDGNWVYCTEPGVIFPRDFSSRREVPFTGHADRAISKEERQVIVGGIQKFSPDGYSSLGYYFAMYDCETGVTTTLADMDGAAGAYHISGNGYQKPGWAIVSVYAPFYPTVPSEWTHYSILAVELTTRKDPPPRVWRVAHSQILRKTHYGDDAFAGMTYNGKRIYFETGWAQSAADGAAIDTYQINLPETWWEDLG